MEADSLNGLSTLYGVYVGGGVAGVALRSMVNAITPFCPVVAALPNRLLNADSPLALFASTAAAAGFLGLYHTT
jgi:hypothetical protein